MKRKEKQLRLSLILIAFALAFGPVASAHGRDNRRKSPPNGILLALTSPLEPAPAGLTGKAIIERMRLKNRQRNARLEQYSEERTYEVTSTTGKVSATEIIAMTFQAPNSRTFVRQSGGGSWAVRKLVFNRLIQSEIKTSSGKAQRSSTISSANYNFTLVGEQRVGPYRCFVVRVAPKRKDKYLFVGTIWIEKTDFAAVRVTGHPAKKLSFWIERADFIRQYQEVDGFWFPAKDDTLVEVRFIGKRVFTIRHRTVSVNGRELPEENATATTDRSPAIPQTLLSGQLNRPNAH